ncbi:hypothetical protein B566_EDAN014696 [Ephemera danica]|nr:hypothetical protein B566_EDAN014696 [Ephemera danica]
MMNSLRSNFKQPGNDHNDKRQKRANAVTDGRKDKRGRSFASRRNLVDCEEMEEPNDDPPNTDTTVNNTENQQQDQTDNKPTSMKVRLLKWKEEKEKQKQKELQLKARSRPPFKAGFVHHDKLPFVAALPPVVPTVAEKTTSRTDSATSSGAFAFTGVQGRKVHAFKPTLKTNFHNTPGTAQAMPASKKKNAAAAALPSAMKQPSVRFATDNKSQTQTRNLRSRVVTIASTPVAEKTAQTPTFSNKRRQRIPVTPYSNPRGRAGSTPASCKTSLHVASTGTGGGKEANKENKPKSTGSSAKPTSKIPSNAKQVPPTVTTRSERATRANRALKMASPVTPENNVEATAAPEMESSEKTAAPNSTAKKTAEETIKTVKKTPVSALKSKIPLQNPVLSTEMPKKPVAIVTRTPVEKAKTPVKIVKTPLKQTPGKQAKEEEHDCRYFRAILAKTIERLEAQCVHWEQEQEKAGDAVTEVANEQLLLATGMARLIIREKFAQFRGLIENCEADAEETKTTCTDLQGFWDMIYIQVEDIEKKFAELEKLKQNNWAALEIEKKEQLAKKKVALAKPKLVVPKGRSNFRAFLAARKNVPANTESKDVPAEEVVVEKPEVATVTRRPLTKTPVGSLVPKKRTSTPNINANWSASRTVATDTRRSLTKTPVGSPVTMSRKRTSSPKINAIWSASRTAKSAGRKSFTQDDGGANSPMLGMQNSGVQPKGTPIPKSGRRKSSTTTPLQSILKNPVPPVTPQSAYAKKMVVFSVPEEPEEDVQKTPIPPVKHTYSHHQPSPMTYSEKDDEFDALFYSAHGSTPKTPTTPTGDEEIGLNESCRTSARFVPYTTEQEESDSDVDMDSDSEITAPVTGSNLNTSKRSSISADLISWDTPVENSVRRSTRSRKQTLTPSK